MIISDLYIRYLLKFVLSVDFKSAATCLIGSHRRTQYYYIMNTLKNNVQLIGRLGQHPEIITFDDGNKMAKFTMATNDRYKDKNGKKAEKTYWHNIIVRGGLVKVVEEYVEKGQEIMIAGKLTNRSWEDEDGNQRYTTEIFCRELLMISK